MQAGLGRGEIASVATTWAAVGSRAVEATERMCQTPWAGSSIVRSSSPGPVEVVLGDPGPWRSPFGPMAKDVEVGGQYARPRVLEGHPGGHRLVEDRRRQRQLHRQVVVVADDGRALVRDPQVDCRLGYHRAEIPRDLQAQ